MVSITFFIFYLKKIQKQVFFIVCVECICVKTICFAICCARSVTFIGSYALASCSSLKTVVILSTAIDIGSNAFYGNRNLTRINATSDICVKVLNSCSGTCTKFRGCPIPSSAPTTSYIPTSRSPSTLPSSVSPSSTRSPSTTRSPSIIPSSVSPTATQSPTISINAVTCSSCSQCNENSNYYYYTALILSGDTAIVDRAFFMCGRLTAIVIPT